MKLLVAIGHSQHLSVTGQYVLYERVTSSADTRRSEENHACQTARARRRSSAATASPSPRSNGPYADGSNQDMLTAALDGLVARFGLQDERIGEVVAGAVLKHSRDFNLTRECVLGSALAHDTPAYDVQQACGTGLEAAMLVANKIALGQIDVRHRRRRRHHRRRADRRQRGPAPRAARAQPGQVAGRPAQAARPRCARARSCPRSRATPSRAPACRWASTPRDHRERWGIPRDEQDELAARSHQRLAAAYERGFFDDLVTPYLGLERDQNLRPDSTPEKLAKLKPVLRDGDATARP